MLRRTLAALMTLICSALNTRMITNNLVCFVDRINDFNKIDNSIVFLRTFMDVDLPEHDDINIKMHHSYLAKSQNLESNPKVVTKSKPRGPYRRYTSNQIERLFDLVIEEAKTAKEAALITGINIRTAQHYIIFRITKTWFYPMNLF